MKSIVKFFSAFLFFQFVCYTFSYAQQQQLFYNGTIYTVDSNFTICDAMVIENERILFTGKYSEAEKKFPSAEKIDLHGKPMYPGFIDAHCHFFGLGVSMQIVDLVGTKSMNEVIERCKECHTKNKGNYIMGRGWDQNDWTKKNFPDNEILNIVFPDIPVVLKRIDGHAALVNKKAIELSKINYDTKVSGGEIIYSEKKIPTGILIDNAVDLVMNVIPKMSKNEIENACTKAEKVCFKNGLTWVVDEGLEKDTVDVISKMYSEKKLVINTTLVNSCSQKNIDYFSKSEIAWHIFKVYIDGALGSRGALLLNPYNDKKNSYGFQLMEYRELQKIFRWCAENNFIVHAHCIGDSATRIYFKLIEELPENLQQNIYKWRIEHAQVINENDFHFFGDYNIIPSVQPTHATSDMYWAEERLGKERMKSAYAYKDLLKAAGVVVLGTDFPVEDVNPMYTFASAVWRMDSNEFPKGGFQIEDALTREEALRGMTIWAAYSVNAENFFGSLEVGKKADFVILENDIMKCNFQQVRKNKVLATYTAGKKVY